MSDLRGFRQVGTLDLEEIFTEEQAERDRAAREQNRKARAYAHVTHAQGTRVDDMTPTQKQMADATANRWNGKNTYGRQYGFSIDDSGRKPTQK